MHRASLAILAVAAIIVAACGEEPAADPQQPLRPATLAELLGPWRATPMRLDPAIRARAEAVCRRDMERLPASVTAVMDARGEGVVTVRMSGMSAGTCDALQIANNGQVMGAGGGSRMDGVEALPALGAAAFGEVETGSVGGGGLTVTGWSVFGRAGLAIVSVVVEPQNHPAVQATLENGWFSAWWPEAFPARQLGRGPAQPTFVVRGYDALGVQIAGP